ncbi:hypothetical protein HQ531_01045 [bacterium]|nr:hypothetical protein [bacterium]
MKRIFAFITVLFLLLNLTACLKPESIENVSVVDITYVDILDTRGYARDVYAYSDKIFVAASAAGTQIWEDNNGVVSQVFEHSFSSNPALGLTVIPESQLLLSFDDEKGYIKQLDTDLSALDSVYFNFPNILIYESENFGDQNTEDMAVVSLNDSLLVLFNTDRDLGDGLRFTYLNRRYEPSEGYYYWEENTIAKFSGEKNYGIDARDSLVSASHGELGIGLYHMVSGDCDTLASHDTPGEALEVKFYDNYLLSANNWAGMSVFALGVGDSSLTLLADIEVNGWVKQISIWNDIAILSCGENGIFLVDLSDPENPKADQPIEAGYTYRTFVANDMIYAATRQGVKRYRIESR